MNKHDTNGLTMRDQEANGRTTPPPELVAEDYLGEMDGMDMTEQQKREFLETLWSIMRTFAELGFEYDVCGQLFGEFNEAAERNDIDVESRPAIERENATGQAEEERAHDR